MSIAVSKYVIITSAVGAGAAVAERELIGRIFSDNPLTPVDAVVEFESAADVGAYYGTASAEYLRAVFYFGWVSPVATKPRKLSFGRWAKAAAPARVYGAKTGATLADFTAVAAGTLGMDVGGQALALTAIDLSGAGSMAAVATALQTAIRAAAGSQYTTATVTYDAPNQRFVFQASTAGDAAISVVAGALAALLGWSGAGAILSPGSDIQTISEALDTSENASTNFGSFAFAETLSTSELTEAGAWNNARNIEYMFCARVPAADAAVISAALIGFSGSGMTLAGAAAEYPELVPMIIMAATNYARANAATNYMFKQFALTPTVDETGASNTYDALRINYYGQTQTAGQKLAFYQRGLLTGGATAAVDMNVYANEVWLKDAARAAMLAMLLSASRVPANAAGRAQVQSVLQAVIDRALFNGVISVDKPLSAAQRAAVVQLTGDERAWQQVQSSGYWFDCIIEPYTGPGGTTEYRAVYLLVYSKDDAIRKVEGSHVLI